MASILSVVAFPVPMGQTASAPAFTNDTSSSRRRFDRSILRLFAVLTVLLVVVLALSSVFVEGVTTYSLASSLFGGLLFAFLLTGVPVYIRHRRQSLIHPKRIFRWMVIISAVATAATILTVVLLSVYEPDLVQFDDMSVGVLLLTGAVIAVTTFVVYLVSCYSVLMVAFGIVGVLVALERSLTPWILRQIVTLGGTKKLSLLRRAIKWLFDIPDVLDTRTLSLDPMEPRTRVSLSDLRAPVLWQLLFGLVLGIYVSFNPFVSDRSPAALLSLFSLLTSACIVFPFLILPWFLLRRLGAGITGQVKQFTLFNGIRARIFQSYFAVGTIVILIRLSIQEIAIAFTTYVTAFATFMITLLVVALLSTFVYLNYFENDLAEDVIEGLRGTDVKVLVEEGVGMGNAPNATSEGSAE